MKRALSQRLMFNTEPTDGAPAGGGVATEPTDAPVEQAPADPAPEAPADPAAEPTGDQPKVFDEAYVTKLRTEAAGHRQKAKTAADDAVANLTKTLGKALGLIKDDEPADPAALTKQIEAERDSARVAKVELAVYRVSGKHGADPDALLDSRAFLAKVKGLDPTADDFSFQVEEAAKAAVDANPKLRVVQAATKAGSDLSAGNADPQKGQLTREQLAAMSPADRLKAVKEGRVSNLIGSK